MKKRFICVLMGIVLVLTTVLSVNALDVIGEDAIVQPPSETISVLKKDMLSGEITQKNYVIGAEELAAVSAYEIPVMGDSVDPNIVVGLDNRNVVTNTTITPYSAIGSISVTFPNGHRVNGTAWLISPNVALTAAHSIYDNAHGGWATDVTIWPGRNGASSPFGSASSNDIIMCQEFADANEGNTSGVANTGGFDWALISFNSNIGQICGTISYGYMTGFQSCSIRVSGYPGDYYDNSTGFWYQVESLGMITAMDGDGISFLHNADTDAGHSGSPLLRTDTNTAIGLNYGNNGTVNCAVRFTPEICSVFNEFINESMIFG